MNLTVVDIARHRQACRKNSSRDPHRRVVVKLATTDDRMQRMRGCLMPTGAMLVRVDIILYVRPLETWK